MTTINHQQKSVLPQRTFKKCATQLAPTSGGLTSRRARRVLIRSTDRSRKTRPAFRALSPSLLLVLSSSLVHVDTPEVGLAGRRITCFKNYASLSHSFADRKTKCPLISTSVSLSSSFAFTLSSACHSYTLSLSLTRIPLASTARDFWLASAIVSLAHRRRDARERLVRKIHFAVIALRLFIDSTLMRNALSGGSENTASNIGARRRSGRSSASIRR